MIIRDRSRGWVLLLAFGALLVGSYAQSAPQTPKKKTATSKKQTTAETKPVLEPKALEILKASSDRLAAAHSMSFTALESYESPSRQGHPLVYVNRSDVTLQRPDKLRVITPGDGPASEFYYDGKTMMAYSPAENLVAIADAPPTIDAALEAAFHSSGTYFPFTDLIVADPYKDMGPGIKLAYYIGQSHEVGDTTTDMVAYVGDGVFAQVWIGVEDKLPRLVHAVYLDDPLQLRHNLLLSNWQIDQNVAADTFTSAKAAGAKRIAFSNPASPPGAHPQAKGAPPKTK